MSDVITRFAPAPTGYLHLGHVLNAKYVWHFARAHHGRVLLRIEDHDRQRCRPEYEAALYEDLAWLGFVPDAIVPRQSERDAAYRDVLASFIARGLVFGCTCTRAEYAEYVGPSFSLVDSNEVVGPSFSLVDNSEVVGPSFSLVDNSEVVGPSFSLVDMAKLKLGPTYPGPTCGSRRHCPCRDRDIALADDVNWRVRFEPGMETFTDLLCGPQTQDPAAQCGDLMIHDRLGNWTYQWAATIDDVLQNVTHVIRGVDLLDSTGRQIRLARLAGRAGPATFMHHPLIMKTPTQKLSKSDGDTGIREMRARGMSPADVLALADDAAPC